MSALIPAQNTRAIDQLKFLHQSLSFSFPNMKENPEKLFSNKDLPNSTSIKLTKLSRSSYTAWGFKYFYDDAIAFLKQLLV